MRIPELISSAAVCIVLLGCAGTGPPRPEAGVEQIGQDAAHLFSGGNFDGALRMYRRALAQAQRIDNPVLQARYHFNIGRIFYECALFDSALSRFTESSVLFTSAGGKEDAAVAGIFKTLTLAYGGAADSAAVLLQAYGSAAGVDNEGVAATAQTIVFLLQGNIEASQRSSERAMAFARLRKDPFLSGGVFYYRAMIAFMRQDARAAREMLDSSLCSYATSPVRYRNWKTLLGRAIVEFCGGDTTLGNRYYLRAKKAVPGMVAFPDREQVRKCPDTW